MHTPAQAAGCKASSGTPPRGVTSLGNHTHTIAHTHIQVQAAQHAGRAPRHHRQEAASTRGRRHRRRRQGHVVTRAGCAPLALAIRQCVCKPASHEHLIRMLRHANTHKHHTHTGFYEIYDPTIGLAGRLAKSAGRRRERRKPSGQLRVSGHRRRCSASGAAQAHGSLPFLSLASLVAAPR